MAKKSFSEYLEYEKKALNNALANYCALDSISGNQSLFALSYYKRLSIIHRIRRNNDLYNEYLERVSFLADHLKQVKEPKHLEEEKFQKDFCLKASNLCYYGKFQFETGVYLLLAHGDSMKIRQLFEWTIMNCSLPDEFLALKHTSHLMNIAFAYLWKGYALLSLERYEEAYDCLVRVAPTYQNVKKAGGEVWHTVEYALTKALVPLCEFKLDPTKENLKKAQKGVEDYIRSIHENKFKLDGYVYYFHLREQFANVYSLDAKTYSEPAVHKNELPTKTFSAPVPSDMEELNGCIVLYDPEKTNALDVLGPVEDLLRLVEYATNLGGFPELAGLFDLYTIRQCTDAKPIAAEIHRFITTPGIDPEMREIARRIYPAARTAADGDSVVFLYYDPELTLDFLEF